MNPAHGTLHSQLLCYGREVIDHVGAQGLVVNGSSIQRVFSEEVVVECQMSQHDHDATLQGETPIRVPSLRELSVQLSQGVEMGVELGNESSRPLKPGL